MHHVIQVGLNTETLRALDDLRARYPEGANRSQIMQALIREAALRQSVAELQRRSLSRCQ
jgi:hypothetical protein